MHEKIWKVFIIIVAVILVIGSGAYTYATWGMNKVQGDTVQPANLAALVDGTYEGRYQNVRWSNMVAVTVSGGKITDIRVLEDVKMPLDNVAEQMIGKVLEKQNINVDVVSTATATSRAYLKAMENALMK